MKRFVIPSHNCNNHRRNKLNFIVSWTKNHLWSNFPTPIPPTPITISTTSLFVKLDWIWFDLGFILLDNFKGELGVNVGVENESNDQPASIIKISTKWETSSISSLHLKPISNTTPTITAHTTATHCLYYHHYQSTSTHSLPPCYFIFHSTHFFSPTHHFLPPFPSHHSDLLLLHYPQQLPATTIVYTHYTQSPHWRSFTTTAPSSSSSSPFNYPHHHYHFPSHSFPHHPIYPQDLYITCSGCSFIKFQITTSTKTTPKKNKTKNKTHKKKNVVGHLPFSTFPPIFPHHLIISTHPYPNIHLYSLYPHLQRLISYIFQYLLIPVCNIGQ